MHKRLGRIGFAVVAFGWAAAIAAPAQPPSASLPPQPVPPPTRLPGKASASFLASWPKQQNRHQAISRLSAATRAVVAAGQQEATGRLPSIPTFQGSFTTAGTTFPFTMAGRDPRRGGTTFVKTSYITLNFSFDEFVDASGNNLVINSDDITGDVLGSPNFVATPYTDGFGQFTDAVQRASFFNAMRPDWHTTLLQPRMLTPVTIEVPVGAAQVMTTDTGKNIAFIDDNFFGSQLNTILQLEDIHSDEAVVLISHNVSTFEALGFHSAFDVTKGNRAGIQTFLWSSWFDLDIFGPLFADATTLTHEVSELVADPFINNVTPLYAIPGSGNPPFCQNLLEVGDAIEFLDTQEHDVTVRGVLFHTQNEALLPWFSRQSPSTAFQGAYSYPDTNVLTTVSPDCPGS